MQKTTSLFALLLLCGPAMAQELTLFEPVETQASDDKPVQATSPLVNQNGQPAYTLRSSARIGDSYSVELVDRAGKITKVAWRAGEHATIPGAAGFTIEDIQQRNLILSQPGNDPCVNAPTKGVSCLATSRAKLTLAVAAPLPPTAQGIQPKANVTNNSNPQNPGAPQNPFEAAIQAQQAQAAAQGQAAPNAGGQGFFINPFSGKAEVVPQPSASEQAARDARQNARAERLNRNEPQRIPDNQVPQGMRRVTTPFGDRLVPVRE